MVAAAAYSVFQPADYHATSLVLLPSGTSVSSTGNSSTAGRNSVTTDGRIAVSAAVLEPAGREVDPSLPLSALESRVQTNAAAGVLAITASGPTAQEAERLANAVADHLVAFVTTSGSAASSDALTGLQAQASQINDQIADVQQEVTAASQQIAADGPTTPAGQQDADLVGKLTAEQANLALQLNTVKSEISQIKLGQISANQGTEVIQQASSAKGYSLTSFLLLLVLGAVGGVVVGSVMVLALHRRDPRLWTRDQLAEALGSPVVLSLDAEQVRSTNDWLALLENYQPSSAEQWNVRKALRELGVGDGGMPQLAVLAFAGDAVSVALAAQVAVAVAGSGLDTAFAVEGNDAAVVGLQAACTRFGPDDGPRPNLRVHCGAQSQWDGTPDLTLTAVVLDGDRPTLKKSRRPGTLTVLAVSAGFASAEQLARVAITAADGGEPVRGIMVANPASEDLTVGRFPASSARTSLVLHRRALGGVQPGAVTERAR